MALQRLVVLVLVDDLEREFCEQRDLLVRTPRV
jgi:hypothetical protein